MIHWMYRLDLNLSVYKKCTSIVWMVTKNVQTGAEAALSVGFVNLNIVDKNSNKRISLSG